MFKSKKLSKAWKDVADNFEAFANHLKFKSRNEMKRSNLSLVTTVLEPSKSRFTPITRIQVPLRAYLSRND